MSQPPISASSLPVDLALNTSSASANNFRDVANGSGNMPYKTRAGEPLRSGVFYRSSAIGLRALRPDTWQHLDIAAVYDLRTPAEIQTQPDLLPERVQYHPVNVLDMDNVVFGSLNSAQETVAFMQDLQRKMVTDPKIRHGFAQVLSQMANTPSAQLFHCSGGKDRTGWLAVLILANAGVSDDDIFEDYLLSNQRLQSFIEQSYQAVATRFGTSAAEAIRPALSVQESFLDAGLKQVVESFGSFENYLQSGLGLSATQLQQLRNKLLDTSGTR